MPGSTPMSVPISTPRNAQKRFVSESAVAKPRARLESSSMRPCPSVLHEGRQDRNGELQAPDEDRKHQHDQAGREECRFLPLELMTSKRGDDDQYDERTDESGRPQQ